MSVEEKTSYGWLSKTRKKDLSVIVRALLDKEVAKERKKEKAA
ncbi:MAG: hypothetical protein V3S69_00565 [Dehalococcoidales bacterium]